MGRLGRLDFDEVAHLDAGAQGHKAPVDAPARAAVAEVGVDAVGEVEDRGPGGQVFTGTWTNGCFRENQRWATVGATAQACGFQ